MHGLVTDIIVKTSSLVVRWMSYDYGTLITIFRTNTTITKIISCLKTEFNGK